MPLLANRPALLKHFNYVQGDIGPNYVLGAGAVTSDTQYKFGGRSLYLPNTYAEFTNDSTFNFGTEDFTIEFWAYSLTSVNAQSFLCVSDSNQSGVLFGYKNDGNFRLYMGSTGTSWDIASALSLGAVVLNTWEHWELGRSGSNFYAFRNGNIAATVTSSLPIYYNAARSTYLGRYVSTMFNGYIDEFRVTKGACLHTSNFTPNTEEYTVDTTPLTGTSLPLLISGDISNTASAYVVGTSYQADIGVNIHSAKIVGNQYQATRNHKIVQGVEGIKVGINNKVTKISQGSISFSGNKTLSKVTTLRSGNAIKDEQIGTRGHIRDADLIKTFTVDSNASNKFNVVVNATHQYKTQSITVTSTTGQSLTGTWSFIVGNNEVIPPGTIGSLSSVTFNVDPSILSVGDNSCRLMFTYPDGVDYIPLVITKEPIKRTAVERTFKSYDGGYNVSNLTKLNDSVLGGVLAAEPFSTGSLSTTSTTEVDLVKYGGIVGISTVSDGCMFLVSFDSGATWYGYDSTLHVKQVDPANISTQGFTSSQLSSLDTDKWSTIFQPTKLSIMVHLDSTASTSVLASYNPIDYVHGYIITNVGSHTYMDGSIVSSGASYTITKPSGYIINRIEGTRSADNNNGSITITSNTHTNYKISPIGAGTMAFEYVAPGGEIITSAVAYAPYVNTYGGGNSRIASYTVYIKPSVAYIKSINITLPTNLAPTITNVTLTPSTLHSGNAVLTATISDPEGDDIQYRVTVNGTTEVTPWTALATEPQELSAIIPFDSGPVGTNSISIQASDGATEATPFTTYITRSNDNPTITGVLTGNILSADVGDIEGDTVRYKVQVNGVDTQDWTEPTSPPVHIDYTIPRHMINIGVPNSVVITAEDSNEGIGSCTFDFVGQYCGLMFTDEQGEFYSDDQGNTISYINLGTFLVGTSSEPKAVIMKNLTGMHMKNIIVTPDELSIPPDTTLKLSLNGTDFEDLDSVTIPGTLAHGDTYTIYVKSYASNSSAGGGNFKLKVNGEQE
jgi:hypothetical protein